MTKTSLTLFLNKLLDVDTDIISNVVITTECVKNKQSSLSLTSLLPAVDEERKTSRDNEVSRA